MASLNKVILIGNLTKDPELKQTPSGTSVVSFSIGVSRKYSGADGSRETDFINVVAWKGTAEFIAKYFRKGNGISIVGSLQVRSYESNGQKPDLSTKRKAQEERLISMSYHKSTKKYPTIQNCRSEFWKRY